MKDILKTILTPAAVAAALCAVPALASAAVVDMSANGTYSLDDTGTIYRFDTDDFGGSDNAGADFYFAFTSSDLPRTTKTTTTVNVTGDFEGLEIAWSSDMAFDAGDTYLDTTASSGGPSAETTFFSIPSSPYYLLTRYSAVSNGGQIDYRISAVPLPAGGVLLLSGFAGLAAARRRRKAA